MAQTFSDNPHYVEYERLLRQLHQLIAEGRGDTDEADRIREEMDEPWRKLRQEEVDRLNGLSADLYMLQADEIFEPADPEERKPERLEPAIRVALDQHEWEQLLALLRLGPTFLSQDSVAFIRAQAYSELGHLDTALLFAEYAARLNSQEPTYARMGMELLLKLGRLDEARANAEASLQEPTPNSVILIQSATLLLNSARGMPLDQALPLRKLAVSMLEQAVLLAPASPALQPRDVASAYTILGFGYELLGKPDEALNSYKEALKVEPSHSGALAARGLLHVETDPSAALADFERAVSLGVQMALPYLYLAHTAITQGDYRRCFELCNSVLLLSKNPEIVANALQWLAIAQYELGVPPDIVRSNFATAVEFDPRNDQIRANQQYFEHLIQSSRVTPGRPDEWPALDVTALKEVYRRDQEWLSARAA
jgi:tetratricopeptide (TPR) repeat protein